MLYIEDKIEEGREGRKDRGRRERTQERREKEIEGKRGRDRKIKYENDIFQ